jgi:hypothetical protein
MSQGSPPPLEDKIFDTLLLDKKILYNQYNPQTKSLSIKYDVDSYELSLQGFIAIYPTRKEYTLQTAGLYYVACLRYGLYPSFIRDDVVSNVHVFQALNRQTHSDFLSMVIVSIPVYLLSVISNVPTTPAQEVLRSSHALPRMGDKKAERSEYNDLVYMMMMGIGVFMVFVLILIFTLVLKTGNRTLVEKE